MFSVREHTDTKSVGNNCFPQNNLVIVPRVSFTSDAKLNTYFGDCCLMCLRRQS